MQFRQIAILAKIETTYGTDAAPTASNGILLADVNIEPMNADKISRNLVGKGLGAQAAMLANLQVKITGAVEIAGSGIAGNIPAYGVLLRACGFSETVDTGVSVKYQPVSAGYEAISIYFYMDENLHKISGARGNLTINLKAGEIGKYQFELTGLFSDIVVGAFPKSDFSGFSAPLIVNSENTPSFLVDGYSGALEEISINMGNQVVFSDRINRRSVKINDRKASGNCKFEAENVGVKDFFDIAKRGTQIALEVTHGKIAGNIIELTAPKVEIDAPKYENSNGEIMYDIALSFIPDTGDDEIIITVK